MRKRVIGLLLSFAMLAGMALPVRAEQTPDAEEAASPVLTIASAEEFVRFAQNCRLDTYSQGLQVSLEADIDLSGLEFESIPIFSGCFDGNGHTVSGLEFTGDGSEQGLFRYVTTQATVEDLTVSAQIHPGGSAARIGGIAGHNAGYIRGCVFSGSLSGKESVGGIAGTNAVTGMIEDCRVSGEIYADHFVGGIAGSNAGVIRNCVNEARINTQPQYNEVELTDITIDALINTEAANTVTDVGGIAGSSSGVIRGCENLGDVGYRHMGYNIGGIAGTQSGYVADCENWGNIRGRKEVGGIIGQMEPSTVIEYTTDTLQVLQVQIDDLSGLVQRTSGSAQANAGQISSQISLLRDQTKTAQEALDTLLPDADDPQLPDADTILAAQNTLADTLEAMPETLQGITAAAETTVSSLGRDLNAISGKLSAMSETVKGASENLGGGIADISDEDTPQTLTGKVENCRNFGDILADMNVGGIAGAIAMENDLDVMEDWEQSGQQSMNFQSNIRAVILNCENSACVTGKKQNVGGIVGWQMFGLVKNSTNTGKVDGSAADRAGGIAGMSAGYIRSSWVKAEIWGKTCTGGIAGSGAVVTDCIAQVKLMGAKEKQGAILGEAQRDGTQLAGNCYLLTEDDPGAIDGISYAALAEPRTAEEFWKLESLPQIFRTVTVSFRHPDGTLTQLVLPAGGKLEPGQIPAAEEKEGYCVSWSGLEEAGLENILFDMTFEAVYTPYSPVIRTDSAREDGKPVLLLEGAFTDRAWVSAQPSEAAPELAKGETLLEVWSVTAAEPGHTARFLLPEDLDAGKAKLYIAGGDGPWQAVSFRKNGSYLVFRTDRSDFRLALVKVSGGNGLWLIGLGVAPLILGVAVFVGIRKRRGRKAEEAQEEAQEAAKSPDPTA